MRRLALWVKYIDQNEFNRVAEKNKSFTSKPSIEIPLYCLIKSRLNIPTARHFTSMFKPQAEQVNLIWVPGTMKKSEADEEFPYQSERDEYYSFVFDRAMDKGRV
ncbi:MAG: hypothetical protein AABY10_00235, partial [Nanoarchaeota archaeon]